MSRLSFGVLESETFARRGYNAVSSTIITFIHEFVKDRRSGVNVEIQDRKR